MFLACLFVGIPLLIFCAWIAFTVNAICDGDHGKAALLIALAIIVIVILRIQIGHW